MCQKQKFSSQRTGMLDLCKEKNIAFGNSLVRKEKANLSWFQSIGQASISTS